MVSPKKAVFLGFQKSSLSGLRTQAGWKNVKVHAVSSADREALKVLSNNGIADLVAVNAQTLGIKSTVWHDMQLRWLTPLGRLRVISPNLPNDFKVKPEGWLVGSLEEAGLRSELLQVVNTPRPHAVLLGGAVKLFFTDAGGTPWSLPEAPQRTFMTLLYGAMLHGANNIVSRSDLCHVHGRRPEKPHSLVKTAGDFMKDLRNALEAVVGSEIGRQVLPSKIQGSDGYHVDIDSIGDAASWTLENPVVRLSAILLLGGGMRVGDGKGIRVDISDGQSLRMARHLAGELSRAMELYQKDFAAQWKKWEGEDRSFFIRCCLSDLLRVMGGRVAKVDEAIEWHPVSRRDRLTQMHIDLERYNPSEFYILSHTALLFGAQMLDIACMEWALNGSDAVTRWERNHEINVGGSHFVLGDLLEELQLSKPRPFSSSLLQYLEKQTV